MGIPTSYTEAQIKAYMEKVLGTTSKKLGWSVSGDHFDEPAHEILFFLGEADFTFADGNQTEIAKLRAVARQEAWRAAMFYTAHEISHSVGAPGTGQTTRGDIHRHSKAMFEKAKAEVLQTYPELISDSGSWSVSKTAVDYDGDYYSNAGDTA